MFFPVLTWMFFWKIQSNLRHWTQYESTFDVPQWTGCIFAFKNENSTWKEAQSEESHTQSLQLCAFPDSPVNAAVAKWHCNWGKSCTSSIKKNRIFDFHFYSALHQERNRERERERERPGKMHFAGYWERESAIYLLLILWLKIEQTTSNRGAAREDSSQLNSHNSWKNNEVSIFAKNFSFCLLFYIQIKA